MSSCTRVCLGWACLANTAVWILDFVVLAFLSYPTRMVMPRGDDGGVVVCIVLFIMLLVDYDGAHDV